jgi:hypothetical protein
MDPEELIAKMQELAARVRPKVPDMDYGDLLLILQNIIQPFGSGSIFLIKERDGQLVF